MPAPSDTTAIRQLAPTLWVGQSRFFFTNAGIFVAGKQACLVDPCMTPEEMARIRAFLTERSLNAQVLVLTHFHWDHIPGPAFFPEAEVVAHRELPQMLAGRGAKATLAEIARWEAHCGFEREQPFQIPAPDRLVDPPAQVVMGNLVLDLLATPGHSPDQIALYEAQTNTLWASDILSDVEIPFVSDSLAAFEETLARLAQLPIHLLVPGHGFPTADRKEIWQRLQTDRAYLTALRQRVERAVAEGRSMVETVELCADMPIRNPAENALPHRRNVESVYAELGGDAEAAEVGWSRESVEDVLGEE